jgi:hypothetical protein
MGKITVTAVVHCWGLTIGRRVIGRYVKGEEMDAGLIGVGIAVAVLDGVIAGRMVDKQTDEVMALFTYYLLCFLTLLPSFPWLYQSSSPPHSLSFTLLSLVIAFAVSTI